MKRSEKLLLTAFALVFVVLVGGGLASMGFKNYKAVTEETEALQKRLATMSKTLAQSAEWQKKNEWLDQHVPKIGSYEEASAKLFETASKEAISAGLKAPAREMLPPAIIKDGDPQGYFDKASVKLTFTDASEEQLFKWMHSLYAMKHFIGITRMAMTPSPQGKSVNCDVDITQFYQQTTPQKLSKN
jgi:hypothetical protein